LDIERAASRLRHDLKLAQLPELKLLCGLSFFDSVASHRGARLESYFREFIPTLATTADKSSPLEFLPEETGSLEKLIDLLKTQPTGVLSPNDISAFSRLAGKLKKGAGDSSPEVSSPGSSVRITCLFVEHYPDLDLSPRGRILNLSVTASRISSSAEEDDVVVRNPVSEPDDRFLAQARDSIKAARTFLLTRYNLPANKRYRFDYAVESTGARFTGDSLGVAFAVGAVAALARTEVLRDKLSVSPLVAFSGALSVDGRLRPVDSDALRLKIYRAFHSNLALLVIPREHLADAQAQVLELERQHPGRKLDLAGAETIESVAGDPRLVMAERSFASTYIARKAWKAKRSVWVEVPALLVLLAVLFYLVAPAKYMPWFDSNPVYAISNPATNSLEAYNRDSTLLWADMLSCLISKLTSDAIGSASFGKPSDFGGDGRNEVVFLPRIDEACDSQAYVRFYSHEGNLLWARNAAILGRCPMDTVGVHYDAGYLKIAETRQGPVIVSTVSQELPARSHIRFWNATGDSLGWYIHWGHLGEPKAVDIDHDGQDELLFTGFNNRNRCVGLLVLRPDAAQGFSPTELGIGEKHQWWIPGNQLAYILFPKSDVGRVPGELPAGYNAPGPGGIPVADDAQIQVYVSESAEFEGSPTLIYTMDHRFRVIQVTMTDILITHRRQLVTEGKLPPIENAVAYYSSIRDAVTYWTDSGWVTEGQLRAAEGPE
jgi:hypothetical protein